MVSNRRVNSGPAAAEPQDPSQTGATAAEMAATRQGESTDPRTAAALHFALRRVRGQVGDAGVQALRKIGFDDEQIVEILAHVALNLYTNDVNLAFAVPVDFPAVKLSRDSA